MVGIMIQMRKNEMQNEQIKVLMIDDDTKLLKLLSEFLPLFQMDVIQAYNAVDGIQLMKNKSPDLIVLDVMMAGMDGFEACREIRKISDIPIIMLSARGDAMDRIVGLELGADDYMAKPFEPRELVTRIQAILRRSSRTPHSTILKFGPLEVRSYEREAYLDGDPLGLSSMEYELLLQFARFPGRKFSRDELMQHLQGFDSSTFSRSIDILISRLRTKLGESARNPVYIKSIHGFGYVFIGEPL